MKNLTCGQEERLLEYSVRIIKNDIFRSRYNELSFSLEVSKPPFDRLTVLSKVEGLTALSGVEGLKKHK